MLQIFCTFVNIFLIRKVIGGFSISRIAILNKDIFAYDPTSVISEVKLKKRKATYIISTVQWFVNPIRKLRRDSKV